MSVHKFKMAKKRPTLESFHFKSLSYDQDGVLPSTSGENTNACSPSIPYVLGSQNIVSF